MENVAPFKLRYLPQIKTFKRILSNFNPSSQIDKILVVGCGKGFETITLKEIFGAKIYGLDTDQKFNENAAKNAQLTNYNGHKFPYNDRIFDVIYSFHVLEHVENADQVLAEMKRVLKPGGVAYIGVPNRSRLFGYFGMRDKSLKQKLEQNKRDWQARFNGKFRNEYGAHAGFTSCELNGMLKVHFQSVIDVTNLYYNYKRPLLKLIQYTGLQKFLFPSVYMLAGN